LCEATNFKTQKCQCHACALSTASNEIALVAGALRQASSPTKENKKHSYHSETRLASNWKLNFQNRIIKWRHLLNNYKNKFNARIIKLKIN
jgi:hypothetical protein